MAPASKQPTFLKDEKVLCFHHEMLYEAKIVDLKHVKEDDKNSPFQYKVHYKGWKSTWDDWVPAERVKKISEENLQLAEHLKRKMEELFAPRPLKAPAAGKKKLAAGSDLSSTRGSEDRQTPVTGRGQKRGRDHDIEKVREHISSDLDTSSLRTRKLEGKPPVAPPIITSRRKVKRDPFSELRIDMIDPIGLEMSATLADLEPDGLPLPLSKRRRTRATVRSRTDSHPLKTLTKETSTNGKLQASYEERPRRIPESNGDDQAPPIQQRKRKAEPDDDNGELQPPAKRRSRRVARNAVTPSSSWTDPKEGIDPSLHYLFDTIPSCSADITIKDYYSYEDIVPQSVRAQNNAETAYDKSIRNRIIMQTLGGRGAHTMGYEQNRYQAPPDKKLLTAGIPLDETPKDLERFVKGKRAKSNRKRSTKNKIQWTTRKGAGTD